MLIMVDCWTWTHMLIMVECWPLCGQCVEGIQWKSKSKMMNKRFLSVCVSAWCISLICMHAMCVCMCARMCVCVCVCVCVCKSVCVYVFKKNKNKNLKTFCTTAKTRVWASVYKSKNKGLAKYRFITPMRQEHVWLKLKEVIVWTLLSPLDTAHQ